MKNLVAGEFKDASNGAVIEVYNPATNELLDTVPNATAEDVLSLVDYVKNKVYEKFKKEIQLEVEVIGE